MTNYETDQLPIWSTHRLPRREGWGPSSHQEMFFTHRYKVSRSFVRSLTKKEALELFSDRLKARNRPQHP